jgi:hypothetical protein
MTYPLSEELLNKILAYLGTSPWTEVNLLICDLVTRVNYIKLEVPKDDPESSH